jgi:exosortase A
MTATATVQRDWRNALLALAGLLAWATFLYWDTAAGMVSIWARSETFTHGFLVLPIVLWLVWRQRETLLARSPAPSLMILPLILAAGFAWLLGSLAAVNAATQFAYVALLVLCVVALIGPTASLLIAFPLLFSFFAVPVGEFLMPQLMAWTADFTVVALRLSGIPVYREGLQFVIPSGNWSVVEACSGVRYLIASLTVGTLFAYLSYRSTFRRVVFVLVSILVPVLANWLRAYIIVMLGHLSGNKLAAGVDHLIYGWLFFGVVIMLMFMIGARWAEAPAAPETRATDEAQTPRHAVSVAWLGTATALMALLLWLPTAVFSGIESKTSTGPLLVKAPAFANGWQAATDANVAFKPAFQNTSAETNALYAKGGQTVGLYLGLYRNQNQERKMVSSSNALVGGNGTNWVQTASASREVQMAGKPHEVRTASLRASPGADSGNSGQLAVWQIYWVGGTLTSSDYLAKAYSAWYRLTGRGDDSAVLILYALKGKAGEAEASLQQFLTDNFGAVNALLLDTLGHKQ